MSLSVGPLPLSAYPHTFYISPREMPGRRGGDPSVYAGALARRPLVFCPHIGDASGDLYRYVGLFLIDDSVHSLEHRFFNDGLYRRSVGRIALDEEFVVDAGDNECGAIEPFQPFVHE